MGELGEHVEEVIDLKDKLENAKDQLDEKDEHIANLIVELETAKEEIARLTAFRETVQAAMYS